jgi:O-antigen ligase
MINYSYSYLLISGLLFGFLSFFGLGYLSVLFIIFCVLFLFYKLGFQSIPLNVYSSLLLVFSIITFSSIITISSVGLTLKVVQAVYSCAFFLIGYMIVRVVDLKLFFDRTIVLYFLAITSYMWMFVFIANGDLSTFKLISVVGDFRVIPDYLMMAIIGYPLLLMKVIKKEFDIYFFLILMTSIFVVYLGGRGPFVILIFLLMINFIRDFKSSFKTILSFVFIGFFLLFFTDIFNVLIERFSVVNHDSSVNIRILEYSLVAEAISNKLILGYGVGSSGIILNYGDVYAYPHNVILETWLELGVIPTILIFTLYMYFIMDVLFRNKKNILFPLSLICLFYLLNALKSGSIYEQRYLYFYLGLFLSVKNEFGKIK